MKIVSVIIYLLILSVWAAIDARREKGKLVKNGIAAWIIKYGLGFLSILYIYYESNVPYRIEVVGVFLIFGALGWIVFDLVYNLFRKGAKWNHVGTTMGTDKIFHKFKRPFIAQSSVKLIILTIGLILL
jgi:hypothetical protein